MSFLARGRGRPRDRWLEMLRMGSYGPPPAGADPSRWRGRGVMKIFSKARLFHFWNGRHAFRRRTLNSRNVRDIDTADRAETASIPDPNCASRFCGGRGRHSRRPRGPCRIRLFSQTSWAHFTDEQPGNVRSNTVVSTAVRMIP